jgi:outer membrane protein OmpA-like peptidoglycan-associated protein
MNNSLMSVVLVLSLVTGVARADLYDDDEETGPPASSEELVGLGAGALLGALLGGPPGVLLGGLGGGFVGKYQHLSTENGSLRAELAGRHAELRQLRADYQALNERQRGRLAKIRRELARQHTEFVSRLGDGIGFVVQFRTASARLEKHFEARLLKLARALQPAADMRVHLAAHADRRGTAASNLRLSKQRLERVAALFRRAGWPARRICAKAYGETRPLGRAGDSEGDDFDRRVVVYFSLEARQP